MIEQTTARARIVRRFDVTRLRQMLAVMLLGAAGMALVVGCGSSGKEGEVKGALRSVFEAYIERDAATFADGWTDEGLRGTFNSTRDAFTQLPRPFNGVANFREVETTLGEISNIVVQGDTATAEAELTEDHVKQRHRFTLVKKDGSWKIDRDERLPPLIPVGAAVIDVRMKEFTIELDSSRVARTTAFQVSNAGELEHEFLVFRVDEASGDEIALDRLGPLKPGEDGAMVVVDLEPGPYAVLCNLIDQTDHLPHAHKGMRVDLAIE